MFVVVTLERERSDIIDSFKKLSNTRADDGAQRAEVGE